MSDILKNLNPAQKEAVVNYQYPSLIVAGAGSGKTRVLTSRIAYMLDRGVSPKHILALTFTNKAAREMRERIATMVSAEKTWGLWMGTFHSLFARILRAEAHLLGYPQSFTIYDAADSKNMVKLAIRELKLDEDIYKPGILSARISRAKNNLITPDAYAANSTLLTEDREQRIPRFLEVYRLYTLRCRLNGAMDFDDLLLITNILFRDHPESLAKYQEQFRYILVDEYQDTNYAQYVIVRRLSEKFGNVCVVGDDAQSIYSFRGAKIENILRFQKDFPDARLFKLEQNYRSTQTIVEAANSVIEKNSRQIRKKSFSAAGPGELIKVLKAYTDREEAALIAGELYAIAHTGIPYSEMAVLYRTNAQSRSLEESLRGRHIPYKIYGGFSFYQRKEIKDLLAYIRLIINPRDNEAFRRVINTPSRGIGDVTVGRIAAAAQERGLSLWEAVNTLDPASIELSGAAGKKVTAFATMIGELSTLRATTEAYTLGLEIATRSGLIGSFKMMQGPEGISALENLEELINSIRVFCDEQTKLAEEANETLQSPVGIEEWMQNVALLTDMDNETPEDRNKVTLMTVHAAKGLEFDYVFVVGLEENLFPSLMCLSTAEGLEEERRLFYVALTRARKAAVLAFAESRFKWGEMTFCRPSRFLGEINPCYLDIAFDLETGSMAGSGEEGERPLRYGARLGNRTRGAGFRGDYRGGSTGQSSPADAQPPRFTPRESRKPAPLHSSRPEGRFKAMGVAPPTPPSDTTTRAFSSEYRVGMRVEHAKFGAGEITAIEEWSNDTKLTVDFGPAGTKVLLKKFARLHIL